MTLSVDNFLWILPRVIVKNNRGTIWGNNSKLSRKATTAASLRSLILVRAGNRPADKPEILKAVLGNKK